MILQALNRYYNLISDDPQSGIARFGYGPAKVSFALNLSPQGELLDLFPYYTQVQRGKKTTELPYKEMIVPAQVKKTSAINSNFLCENSAYSLGISDKDNPTYALERHEAFQKWNIKLLSKADSEAARAVIAFLENYDPHAAQEHPVIARHLEEILKGRNLVFMLHGNFVHEDTAIRQVWDEYKSENSEQTAQCLITGENAPVARLHPNLKGVRDARIAGAALISFNERAYESYNRVKGQGMNSPISERATFAYTTVLNYLLSSANPNKKIYLGDTTVVYWAESKNKTYEAVFRGLFVPEYIEQNESADQREREKAEQRLGEVAAKVKYGRALDASNLMEGLAPDTQFYILGLAPNSARVSVRFFHVDIFENMVNKVMAHYADLEIVKEFDNQPTYITIRQILNETVSKKASKQDPSPLMSGAVFRSILMDTPYPAALYYAIINRIRADMDDSSKGIRKINYVRAAVIKAFLKRKYRNRPQQPFKEVLVMSLNAESTIPAYVLGRLFAVLEKAQQDAVGDVNASIKDRYFTSACASPANVFPILLRLSQHHISKAEYGYTSDRRIEKLLNLLDVEKNPIPARLTLDEQGVFVLGYYHQRKDLWTSKSKNVEPKEITS